jgi:hypothetical protein
MRKILIFIILSVVATVVFADEGKRRPIAAKFVKQYFRLQQVGSDIIPNGDACRVLLGPEIPDGKVFVADYASINIRVVNAPADLEGFVTVYTGFVSNETLPSLGKLERAGDEFVLGEQVGFLMINPTEDAHPLALVARFTAPFPEPAEIGYTVFCWGRIDGRLIDSKIYAKELE